MAMVESTSIFDDDCSPLEDGMDRFVNIARAVGSEVDDTVLKSSAEVIPRLLHLVQEALSHPRIYAGFYELKAACVEAASSFPLDAQRTLDLFAVGTCEDYYRNKTHYLRLTPQQLLKLQQLSLVSTILDYISKSRETKQVENHFTQLASSRNAVPYHVLRQAIFIDSGNSSAEQHKLSSDKSQQEIWQLEQLLVFLIQNSIVSGKMNQKEKCLVLKPDEMIGYCISRDVHLNECKVMIEKLEAFQQRTNATFQIINNQMEEMRLDKNVAANSWKFVDQYIEKMKRSTIAASKKQQGKQPSLVGTMSAQHGVLDTTGLDNDPVAAVLEYRDASRRSKRSRGGPLIANMPTAARGIED